MASICTDTKPHKRRVLLLKKGVKNKLKFKKKQINDVSPAKGMQANLVDYQRGNCKKFGEHKIPAINKEKIGDTL